MNARSGKPTLLTPAAVRHWWKFARRATAQQGIKPGKRGASLLLDYRRRVQSARPHTPRAAHCRRGISCCMRSLETSVLARIRGFVRSFGRILSASPGISVIWRRRTRPAMMLTTSYIMLLCERITSFVKIAIIGLPIFELALRCSCPGAE